MAFPAAFPRAVKTLRNGRKSKIFASRTQAPRLAVSQARRVIYDEASHPLTHPSPRLPTPPPPPLADYSKHFAGEWGKHVLMRQKQFASHRRCVCVCVKSRYNL